MITLIAAWDPFAERVHVGFLLALMDITIRYHFSIHTVFVSIALVSVDIDCVDVCCCDVDASAASVLVASVSLDFFFCFFRIFPVSLRTLVV